MHYLSITLFIFGVYVIALELLKLPSIQISRNIISFYNQGNKKNSIVIFLDDVASKIAKLIKLSEYKRNKIEIKLKNAEIYKTPEKYLAENYIKAAVPIIIMIPLYFINFIIFPVAIFISIYIYFGSSNSLDKHLEESRNRIEYELPRFTRDIAEYLKSDRNILMLLERYKETAGEHLKKELEITIADMKTGNYETALTRLETRVQSPMLSNVVRGLIAVVRGDSSQFYFQILAHDFKALEYERLKNEAIKRPEKIKKYSFILLVSMILMWSVVIVISVIQSSKGLFI